MSVSKSSVRRLAVAVAVVGVATVVPGTPGTPVPPAAAQAGCENEANSQACRARSGRPGRTVDLTPEVAPRVSGGVKTCSREGVTGRWVDYGPPFPADFDPGPPPNAGARYWVFVCPNYFNGISNDLNWEGAGWGVTPPATPPTAANVLPPLWEEVEARLRTPEIALDPAEGGDSVLKVPTFVEILNPQVATRYTATAANPAGRVTVSIDVVPTVTLNPGEPDAEPVPCDDDGTAFDPDGSSPQAQVEAAGGACTYTYTHRNAAGWGGDVTITWDVEWSSDVAGDGGALAADPSVQDFVRIVDEVVTVVVDVDGSH